MEWNRCGVFGERNRECERMRSFLWFDRLSPQGREGIVSSTFRLLKVDRTKFVASMSHLPRWQRRQNLRSKFKVWGSRAATILCKFANRLRNRPSRRRSGLLSPEIP
jgi:hypothetical protein